MTFLCNVDPENPNNAPTADELLASGVRGVRLVSREVCEPYVQDMHDHRLIVLAIITEQSQGYVCNADVWQIGNEPDLASLTAPYTSGDDHMGTTAYVNYWKLYYNTWFGPGRPFDGAPVITAGFASGNPNYWQYIRNALPGVSGLAVHPYAKTATQAKALLTDYQKLSPGLPIWVTEWNRPTVEIPGFAMMLRQMAAMSFWYAWGGQPDPQFDLTDEQMRLLGAT